MSKAKLAIDLEGMLGLPASVFWKDRCGYYLGCNDVMAELASIRSRQLVVGIDDVELLGSQAAGEFITNDREIITAMKPRVITEYYRNEKDVLIKGVSTKAPLFNVDGTLIGLWGISFLEEVTGESNQRDNLSVSVDVQNKYTSILSQTHNMATHYAHKHFIAVEKLSDREIQCLQRLARGLSAKAIGEELNLSKRTVESYRDNIKAKLGCINKTELIVAAIKHKYIDIDTI
jgi:DNA-binding CsgD family transcriptional regulator